MFPHIAVSWFISDPESIDLDILGFWVHGFFNSLVIGMIVVTKDMMGSAITKTAIATKNFNL